VLGSVVGEAFWRGCLGREVGVGAMGQARWRMLASMGETSRLAIGLQYLLVSNKKPCKYQRRAGEYFTQILVDNTILRLFGYLSNFKRTNIFQEVRCQIWGRESSYEFVWIKIK
jgi:hypothetical protein